MKKLIVIITILFAVLFVYPSEWINVDSKDYKICKIDTINKVIICSGWYDVIEEDGVFFPEFKGGLGNYFFYNNPERSDAIILTEEKLRQIINSLHPKIKE